MGIIIAYKRGDTIYMGTDTRVIQNETKTTKLSPSCHKIQVLQNGILLGISSSYEMSQTLFAYSDIFTLDKKERLTKKHIVREIIPYLMTVLEKNELLEKEDDNRPFMKANIILAYKDTMFEICSNLMVIRYEDFQAVGLSDYVQPLLFSIKDEDDVNEKILLALERLSKKVYSVGPPFLLIDTKELTPRLKGEETC